MKRSYFKNTNNKKIMRVSLAEGKALVRGYSEAKLRNEVRTIVEELCFLKKETIR